MENEWFQALVIILSVMLGLFLLLSIVILVRLVQISKQVKRITDQAEEAVDKAGHIASFFQKTATPVALVKLVSNISDAFQKSTNKGKKK